MRACKETGGVWFDGGASGLPGKGPTGHWAQGTRGEVRTQNIMRMLVTLDVSRLSGWLNADAPCGVERRSYEEE